MPRQRSAWLIAHRGWPSVKSERGIETILQSCSGISFSRTRWPSVKSERGIETQLLLPPLTWKLKVDLPLSRKGELRHTSKKSPPWPKRPVDLPLSRKGELRLYISSSFCYIRRGWPSVKSERGIETSTLSFALCHDSRWLLTFR